MIKLRVVAWRLQMMCSVIQMMHGLQTHRRRLSLLNCILHICKFCSLMSLVDPICISRVYFSMCSTRKK